MIYTTLNKIRSFGPCGLRPDTNGTKTGLCKLLAHLGKGTTDDEPLALSVILESNGLDDALWCLRSVPEESKRWRLLAVKFARTVQHLMTDPRSLAALDVAERHARGIATDSELSAAGDAAWAAACDAARGAAGDAARDAARDAAWAAAGDAARGAAWAAACDAARDAAWAAARGAAGDAARDAAWDAARGAAGDAAWAAAWDAARGAARDAMSQMFLECLRGDA